jgi:hypothetical protein
MNEEPVFSYCDKIKFLEAIQKSLENTLDIKLSTALFALKVSMVVMTPQLFVSMISRFMHTTLSDYGLSLFLTEDDFDLLGPKELTLFLVSYIGMLFHYANLTPVCF